MLPRRTRLDPEGYYDRLGVEPAATRAAVIAAFRAKARLLHPDVPGTGDAAAFVAVRQAYDVLSNRSQRAAYDRKAREVALDAIQPDVIVDRTPDYPMETPTRQPRFSDLPVVVWVGVAAFLCLGIAEVTIHLLAPSVVVRADIRPNAAAVQPLSASAHRAVLYGPTPVRLAGAPNFYVKPSGGPTMLWRLDAQRKALVALGQLPPFSQVQALRLIRQTGMLEVLVDDKEHGFISADHLAPGNAVAARSAYCGYNAGPAPLDGELLERHGTGDATLVLENRAMQPVVVKLRNAAGSVAVSVFLQPAGHVELNGLPKGTYQPEFAIGELWSRACNVFAAGMRARRIDAALRLPGDARLVVAPDAEVPTAADIPDQAFAQE